MRVVSNINEKNYSWYLLSFLVNTPVLACLEYIIRISLNSPSQLKYIYSLAKKQAGGSKENSVAMALQRIEYCDMIKTDITNLIKPTF